jgi:hypothetical protein
MDLITTYLEQVNNGHSLGDGVWLMPEKVCIATSSDISWNRRQLRYSSMSSPWAIIDSVDSVDSCYTVTGTIDDIDMAVRYNIDNGAKHDIILNERSLSIEFNGAYFTSIEAGTDRCRATFTAKEMKVKGLETTDAFQYL